MGHTEQYPLHAAIKDQNLDEVSALIATSDVNAEDALGHTPLYYAVTSRNELFAKQAVKFLLKAGANPGQASKRWLPLYLAVMQEKCAVVQLLLQNGANPDSRDPDNDKTALIYAVQSCSIILSQLLLPYADPALPGVQGRSAIEYAMDGAMFFSYPGHAKQLRLFLSHPKSNPNPKGAMGLTYFDCTIHTFVFLMLSGCLYPDEEKRDTIKYCAIQTIRVLLLTGAKLPQDSAYYSKTAEKQDVCIQAMRTEFKKFTEFGETVANEAKFSQFIKGKIYPFLNEQIEMFEQKITTSIGYYKLPDTLLATRMLGACGTSAQKEAFFQYSGKINTDKALNQLKLTLVSFLRHEQHPLPFDIRQMVAEQILDILNISSIMIPESLNAIAPTAPPFRCIEGRGYCI